MTDEQATAFTIMCSLSKRYVLPTWIHCLDWQNNNYIKDIVGRLIPYLASGGNIESFFEELK